MRSDAAARDCSMPRRLLSPGAALLLVTCAVLLGAGLALPQAAHADPAPGQFAWPQPWLYGTVKASLASSLLKGPAGSLYAVGVTGHSQSGSTAFVARLGADGSQKWRMTRPGVHIAGAACDRAHNVVIVGSRARDIVVVKYRAADGKVLWATRWGGRSTSEWATGVAVSSNGAVYVTGGRRTARTKDDAVVLCLAPGGRLRWRHLDATRGDDTANAVTTDGPGNAYVTGNRAGARGASAWSTYKLSPSGKRLWLRTVKFVSADGLASGRWLDLRGGALRVVAQRSGSTYRVAAQSLTRAGKTVWLNRSCASSAATLFAQAAIDGKGRLYLAGHELVNGVPGVTTRGVLVVCRADGRVAWQDGFENQLGAFSTLYGGVIVDAKQRAYCAGWVATQAGDGARDAAVVRYARNGGIDTVWRRRGDVAGDNAFGSLLQAGAVYAGGWGTMAAGSRAVVQRLKP